MKTLRALGLLLAIAMLTACSHGVLNPQGPVGKAERMMLLDATVIMLAIVVPVIIATLIFAWWFRAGNRRARYRPDWNYSGRLEMIVWSIPALVVMFLGGIAWIGSHQLHPATPLARAAGDTTAPLQIDVVSLDWKWLFIYPEQGIATVNRLVIPTHRQVKFRLTSTSVMNSFFVPQLGSQIYTMPGMTTQLYLQADHPGSYKGLSAQFSGEGFSDMHFTVAAIDAGQFEAWAMQAQQASEVLDEQALTTLLTPSVAHAEQTFTAKDTRVFDRLIEAHMAPRDQQGLSAQMCTSSPTANLLSLKD